MINFQLAGRLTYCRTLIGHTLTSISCWIVVALTIDRFVLVRLPYRAAKLSTAKRTYISLVTIVLLCCGFNSVWAVELYEVPVTILPCTGLWQLPYQVVKADGSVYIPLRFRPRYQTYSIISTGLILYALPVIIIIVCNTLISRSFCDPALSTLRKSCNHRRRRMRELRLCRMILTVSVIFIICNIPDIISRVLCKFISPVAVGMLHLTSS